MASGEIEARTGVVERSIDIPAFLGGWGLPIALYLAMAAVLEVVGLVALANGPREPFGGDWQDLVYTGRYSELLSIWQRWDALWYQHIAETGYRAGETAFFPLYPFTASVVSLFLVGNTVLALLAVSAVAFVAGMRTLWKLVHVEVLTLNDRVRTRVATEQTAIRVATLTVLLVASFPTGFFLVAPFTEALFLALAVASLHFARTDRPGLAGVAGFFASLARAQGVFLSLPLAFEHLRERGTLSWLRGQGGRPPGVGLIAALLPVVGTLTLVAYQRLVLGEQHSGFDLLAAWGYRMVAPWDAVAAAWSWIKGGHAGPGQAEIEALNLICLIAFSAIAVLGAKRLPLAYWLYTWPSLGLLLTREMYFSPIMSTARYVLAVFPCFIVLALWLAPRPRVAALVVVAGVLAQIALFQYFVRWGFVG